MGPGQHSALCERPEFARALPRAGQGRAASEVVADLERRLAAGGDEARAEHAARLHRAQTLTGPTAEYVGANAREVARRVHPDASYSKPGNTLPPPDWFVGIVERPDGTVEYWERGERQGVARCAA